MVKSKAIKTKDSTVRELLQKDIDPMYRVDFEDLAVDVGFAITNDGRILFEDIADLPPAQLLSIMAKTAVIIEHIDSRRSLVVAIAKQQSIEADAREARLKLKYQEERKFERGSKSEAELFSKQDEGLVRLRKKIASYEAFAQYLKNLIDVFTMSHYMAKAALNSSKDRYNMEGSNEFLNV